jgi:hypothetical protein
MSTKSPTFLAKLNAGARRLDVDEATGTKRPYLMFPAKLSIDGADVPIMLFIGLSKKERSESTYADGSKGPAIADSRAKALGFADHMAAVQNPELTEGRECPVYFEEASDKGPGGWKIMTAARSVDLNEFADALAALDG